MLSSYRNNIVAFSVCALAIVLVFFFDAEKTMPPKPSLIPANFPRPPLLERTSRHLQVKWNGSLVADTKEGYWVLETYHPPSELPLYDVLLIVVYIWRFRGVYIVCRIVNAKRSIYTKRGFYMVESHLLFSLLSFHLTFLLELAYYLPPSSLQPPFTTLLQKSQARSTMCEWKGAATYWDISLPPPSPSSSSTSASSHVRSRIWSYESPTPGFTSITGYLSFYAGPWQCFVDGEEVEAQPGDFYGGWVTSEVQRDTMKGKPGTGWW